MINRDNKIYKTLRSIIQKFKNFENSLTRKRKIFYAISLFFICIFFCFPGATARATLMDAILNLLTNLFLTILSFLGWIATKLMIALVFFATWGKYTTGIHAVVEGWKIARDICNMFFIFILLIISFATIIGIESYSYKKWLGKVVIFSILINFSKMITGLLIDVSQIVMLTFVSGFKDATVGNFAKGLHLDQLMKKEAGTSSEEKNSSTSVFVTVVLACIMLVVLNVILVIMIVMLVGRILSFWILAILSPFAFLLQASPAGGKYANEWWQSLSKNLISGPILAMFIYLTMATIQNSVDADHNKVENLSEIGGVLDKDEENMGTSGATVGQYSLEKTSMILDFIIVIAMMIAAIRIAGSLGVMGSSFAGNMSNKLQKAGSSALKLGMAGVGAATGANYLAKRYRAYKEIRKDRKDQKAYQDAQKFMDRTGKMKQGVGKFMQNPLKSLSSDRNKVGRFFKGAEQKRQNVAKWASGTWAGRRAHDLNFAQKARERAEKSANAASHLSYARSMGVRNTQDIDNLENGLDTRRTNIDRDEAHFIEEYRNSHPGANITDIDQIDKGTLNEDQRVQLDNLNNNRKKIETEQGHIDGLRDLVGGLDVQEAEFINNYRNNNPTSTATDLSEIDRRTLTDQERNKLYSLMNQRTRYDQSGENKNLETLDDLYKRHNIKNEQKNSLDRQEAEFINNYRNNNPGVRITSLGDIDRTTLNDQQRTELAKLEKQRNKLGEVGPAINNYEDVLANTRILDETINHFQEKSEKSSRAAQGWTEFGTGAAAVFRRSLLATSFLAPFASALGGSFFAPLANLYGIHTATGGVYGALASSGASWSMAAAAAPGLTSDAGKALERSGQADVRDAANYLSNKVMDAAKKFEDMDTGMVERMRDDIKTSNVDYMAAQFQLLKRGLVGVDQIPQLLSDLQNRGADRNTLRSFEGEIRKQFPTEGRWLDAQGRPLLDGDRGSRQAEQMRLNGVGRVLEGINATGYTQEIIRNAIRESRTPAELRADANRLSIEQQRGVAQVSHRILIEDSAGMNTEDLNKLAQFLSTSLSSNVNREERQTMSREAYNELIGRDDIAQINTADLLVNMDLNDAGLDQRQLLANINPVEIGNMVRTANDLGGDRKTMVNDWLGQIRPLLDQMLTGNQLEQQNAQRIIARLGQMQGAAALNTMNNLDLY
ncbi:MAG: hypothetical protein PHH83_00035 [Patescibacteria group bacterium]|nr:hypothetical protein [Patescibacteria group bacterium]